MAVQKTKRSKANAPTLPRSKSVISRLDPEVLHQMHFSFIPSRVLSVVRTIRACGPAPCSCIFALSGVLSGPVETPL